MHQESTPPAPLEAMSRMVDEVTQRGEFRTREELMEALYDRLRSLAAGFLQHERANHTLQPTALIHEAWVRLASAENLKTTTKAMFMAAAATTFRRVLVDHARRRNAAKRRGGEHLTLTDPDLPASTPEVDVLALNDAMQRLEKAYPRQHRVVELKYFTSLQTREIAELLEISERTVADDWAFARAWLRVNLSANA